MTRTQRTPSPAAPPVTVTCSGRAVDRDGTLHGKPCGKTSHRGCGRCATKDPQERETHLRAVVLSARVRGWRIGPRGEGGTYDAMCPRCARPAPGASWRTPVDLDTSGGQDPLPLE